MATKSHSQFHHCDTRVVDCGNSVANQSSLIFVLVPLVNVFSFTGVLMTQKLLLGMKETSV